MVRVSEGFQAPITTSTVPGTVNGNVLLMEFQDGPWNDKYGKKEEGGFWDTLGDVVKAIHFVPPGSSYDASLLGGPPVLLRPSREGVVSVEEQQFKGWSNSRALTESVDLFDPDHNERFLLVMERYKSLKTQEENNQIPAGSADAFAGAVLQGMRYAGFHYSNPEDAAQVGVRPFEKPIEFPTTGEGWLAYYHQLAPNIPGANPNGLVSAAEQAGPPAMTSLQALMQSMDWGPDPNHAPPEANNVGQFLFQLSLTGNPANSEMFAAALLAEMRNVPGAADRAWAGAPPPPIDFANLGPAELMSLYDQLGYGGQPHKLPPIKAEGVISPEEQAASSPPMTSTDAAYQSIEWDPNNPNATDAANAMAYFQYLLGQDPTGHAAALFSQSLLDELRAHGPARVFPAPQATTPTTIEPPPPFTLSTPSFPLPTLAELNSGQYIDYAGRAAKPTDPKVHASTDPVDPLHPDLYKGASWVEVDNYKIVYGPDSKSVTIINGDTNEVTTIDRMHHVDANGNSTFDFQGASAFVLENGTVIGFTNVPQHPISITQGDWGAYWDNDGNLTTLPLGQGGLNFIELYTDPANKANPMALTGKPEVFQENPDVQGPGDSEHAWLTRQENGTVAQAGELVQKPSDTGATNDADTGPDLSDIADVYQALIDYIAKTFLGSGAVVSAKVSGTSTINGVQIPFSFAQHRPDSAGPTWSNSTPDARFGKPPVSPFRF